MSIMPHLTYDVAILPHRLHDPDKYLCRTRHVRQSASSCSTRVPDLDTITLVFVPSQLHGSCLGRILPKPSSAPAHFPLRPFHHIRFYEIHVHVRDAHDLSPTLTPPRPDNTKINSQSPPFQRKALNHFIIIFLLLDLFLSFPFYP